MVADADATHILAGKPSDMREEADNIYFDDFVLLSTSDIKGSPEGRRRRSNSGRKLNYSGFLRRFPLFLWPQNDPSLPVPIPAGGAAVAMGKGILIGRQVVMNHMTDIINVKATRSEVCADERQRRTADKAEEGALTISLFHTTMKGTDTEALTRQIVSDALYTLTMVRKDDRRLRTYMAEQSAKGLQLVFLRRTDKMNAQTILGREEIQFLEIALYKRWNLLRISGREQEAVL